MHEQSREVVVRGTTHQGGSRFSPDSAGKQCTPISFVAVLYSMLLDVQSWSSDTIDRLLSYGDVLYRSVPHTEEYFDYSELPLSFSLPDSDQVLSCAFGRHLSGFMHSSTARPGFWTFQEAVASACENALGCLVTVNKTTVAVMRRAGLFYVFDPHARSSLGRQDSNGTAVLLPFLSLEYLHYVTNSLHSIGNTSEQSYVQWMRVGDSAEQCYARWAGNHNEHCQFDVVEILAVSHGSGTPQVTSGQGSDTTEVSLGQGSNMAEVVSGHGSNTPEVTSQLDGKVTEEHHACQLCGKSFRSQATLDMHVIRAHRKRKALVFTNSSLSKYAKPGQSLTRSYSDAVKGQRTAGVLSDISDVLFPCLTSVNTPQTGNGSNISSTEFPPVDLPSSGYTSNDSQQSSAATVTSTGTGKQRCVDCGKWFVSLANHKKCTKKLVNKLTPCVTFVNTPQSGNQSDVSGSEFPCVTSVDLPESQSGNGSDVSQQSSAATARSTGTGKQMCNGCGKWFVNVANHKKCTNGLLKERTEETSQATTSTESTDSQFQFVKRKKTVVKRQKGRNEAQVTNRYWPLSMCDESDTTSAATVDVQADNAVDVEPMDGPTCERATTELDFSPRKKGATRKKGTTEKKRTRLQVQADLEKLKRDCIRKNGRKEKVDPLLEKLTAYHNRLSSQAENVLTEKVSAEVAEVVNDLSCVDDVSRTYQWTKADEARLNQLNADAKKLDTPDNWTWAAKEGTDQFEYNHKRLQYFVEHELQTVVKHCSKCKATGILVGLDQIDSEYCHDCLLQSKANKEKTKEKEREWDKVRPKSMEYPKRLEPGHETEDLPRLYPGDKSVISPVHPVVTVRKNYFANKKLRQESITLMQDAAQTWCKILPRTELKDRYVVIERTSVSHSRRHIIANPESVAIWLSFLFKNHSEFVRKEEDGELQLNAAALRVLESHSELGEVLEDVEYMSDPDEDSVSSSSVRPVKSPESRVTASVPPRSSGVLQAELESGFSKSDVFTFDKFPSLYLKAQDFLRIKQSGHIEVIDDRQSRVPIYNVSATMAFPYLYPRGEESPLDNRDFKMSRYLLKKQTLFAYKMADASYNWEYAQDDTHLMYQYARLVELTVNANATWYLQETPDVAHLPMDEVLQAFKNGFSDGDESLIDSKMPGLSSLMAKLPNSRERWYSERLGIEAISRDFGEPNLFLTLSNDPRSTYDTRSLLYSLQHGGAQMPLDHPYELDTERFTELISRYAPQMAIYLCRKTKMFLKAFLCDICGISEKEPNGDWMERDRSQEGYYWGRVEFTETRGNQHWHILCKLPHVLDTALIGRMIQNLRVVRQEMKCGNIKPGKEDAAWEIIEVGLLASRYATLFTDSISTASFYTEDMPTGCHDPDKVVDLDKLRKEYLQQLFDKNVSMRTNPIMRRFCDVQYCDENRYVEMAKTAAVSCVHNCIQTVCGGDEKTGKGCRFDFPKRNLNHTVPAVMQVNCTQMEARMLLRRTCGRVPNLNQYFLLYWRCNHDVSVLVDAAHKMRYATKYAAKTGKYTELLNEIIEYLSQRSMDLIPTSMRHVLSQLLLADVSHRAFMSKQELSYRVMDLPVVRRTFANVDVVGFYRRSYITLSTDNSTIILSDRTEYSAYAERNCEQTVIQNRKNARAENVLSKEMIAAMNFREFAETISCEWHTDSGAAADMANARRSRRILSREVNFGHWILKRRVKRRHIRFSTVLYTDAASEYEPVDEGETAVQPTFFGLPIAKRKQLYRAYMELVCYVPWSGSPEETFLDESQRKVLEDGLLDPEKDHRYSLRRLEMFFGKYMQRWNRGEVAPEGSQWRRDNQYSYTMYLTTQHNVDVHMQRVENDGMLKARFEADDELRDTGIDLRYDIRDEVDQSEYPSALNFLPPETFKDLLDQKPPELAEISVAFPTQCSWQQLEQMVKVEKNKLFMAQPPACSVAYRDMTAVQQWAVDLGTDMKQKVLYLCGKAGCGKTQVALKICERLRRLGVEVQAAASTGKAASLLGAPTVHGMFRWGTYDRSQYGDTSFQIDNRKLTELRTFYENTQVFIVDEVNAMSAAMLAQMHETMSKLFNANKEKDEEGNGPPFGGKKVIFLGDPAQLKPVMGEAIYAEGSRTSTKPGRVRGCRGKLQVQYHQTSKGQELYRRYLAGNCVLLNRGQRNSGLLQQICDRLRGGQLEEDDLVKLTCRRRQFPTFVTDFTLHYENERCLFSNLTQLWSECSGASPAKRLYICKASYHTTSDNHSVVDGLAALPPQNFAYAADVVCVAVGCDVRLIKNVNVSAGLVNAATGKVVQVIYDNADSTALLAGKHPPPYCIIVSFEGFRGFLIKTGNRVHPFPNQPQWVPIYREKFVAPRSEIPSWIVKKQAAKDCWRVQFPLDLCRAMTCHRAQGQTLANCTVSVDLGLVNPDRQLPQDISSILYVACTRVPCLQDLFVSPIHTSIWKKIGKSVGDVERRKVEEKLRKAAEDFASAKGMYTEVKAELDWKPDYSKCDGEWKDLEKGVVEPVVREMDAVVVNDGDLLAESSSGRFCVGLKPVLTERHIGLDQGSRNFGMVAIDKEVGKSPVVVAAEHFDLGLENCEATDVMLKLLKETDLGYWMQQTERGTTQGWRRLKVVDRVIVHVEQMSVRNPEWKHFGVELGTLLQQKVTDVSTCIVKMSSPHLLRAGGVIHHLGSQIVDELKLVPVTYVKKGKKPQCSKQTQQTQHADVEPDSGSERVNEDVDYRQKKQADVEPGCDSEKVSEDVDYRQRKQVAADIFRYFVYAEDDMQSNMGVSVVQEVQDLWQERIGNDPKVKLDDVGDALLHGLNDILCGGSSYRQLVPSNVSVRCNRTVVIAVCPDYTYWVVVHCTWNIFIVEDVGSYATSFRSRYYNARQTVEDIKQALLENAGSALTDMTGDGHYRPVDVIKMVVKNLKGFGGFKGKHAGALQTSVITALREISDEHAGSNSMVTERKDKVIGSLYVRTNMATSQKFQVVSSSGKLTNAILACFEWMTENASTLVEKRTFSVGEETKLRFFDDLCELARSTDEQRLGLIEVSDSLKQKLIEGIFGSNNRKMFGYLILLAISRNEQKVTAIAANYRHSAVKSKVK